MKMIAALRNQFGGHAVTDASGHVAKRAQDPQRLRSTPCMRVTCRWPTSVATPGSSSSLEPGVCVLVGPNGHGKTNLVEAVGYVATHGSHRVARTSRWCGSARSAR